MRRMRGTRGRLRTMKALSIHQPYASLIAHGLKTIEVRTWRTHYRGPFVVCASATRASLRYTPPKHAGLEYPLGVALAIVDLIDVREGKPEDRSAAFADATGKFAWVLANPRRVAPVKIKGQQGWFQVADFATDLSPNK